MAQKSTEQVDADDPSRWGADVVVEYPLDLLGKGVLDAGARP